MRGRGVAMGGAGFPPSPLLMHSWLLAGQSCQDLVEAPGPRPLQPCLLEEPRPAPGRFGGHARRLDCRLDAGIALGQHAHRLLLKVGSQETIPMLMSAHKEAPGSTPGCPAVGAAGRSAPEPRHKPSLTRSTDPGTPQQARKSLSAPKHRGEVSGVTAHTPATNRQLQLLEAGSRPLCRPIPSTNPGQCGAV